MSADAQVGAGDLVLRLDKAPLYLGGRGEEYNTQTRQSWSSSYAPGMINSDPAPRFATKNREIRINRQPFPNRLDRHNRRKTKNRFKMNRYQHSRRVFGRTSTRRPHRTGVNSIMSFHTRNGRGICMLMALSTLLAIHSAVQGATGPNANARFARTDDVSLQANGELRGQVLDQQGQPQALTQVVFLQNNRAVGYTKTDITGQFVMPGLRPGAYQIQTGVVAKSVRIWAARTAPPVARQAVLLVADGDIARAKSEGKSSSQYGPAIRGAIVGGVITGLTFWAFDYNAAS